MATSWVPGVYKRNVYLFQDDHTEKLDSELPDSDWVWEQLSNERFDRATADKALLKEIENETSRAVEVEDSKENLSNKVTSDVSYISDDTHYATTAAVDQRIADISPKQIEWATYGTTTNEQLQQWLTDGKLVLCKYSNRIYRLTYYQSASSHHFSSVDGINGYSNTWPRNYSLSCIGNTWTNYSTNLECENHKMKSTSTWVSDDFRYPTTKAVKNYVAEHAGKDVEWATYGTTTNEQLYEWYTNDKLVLCKYDGASVARGVYRMTTCNSTSAHFDTVYSGTISGVPELHFFAYLCCKDNEWTNNVAQVNFQNLETKANKLASTATWSSDDTKYPTTKAVENKVNDLTLELTGEGGAYTCRSYNSVTAAFTPYDSSRTNHLGLFYSGNQFGQPTSSVSWYGRDFSTNADVFDLGCLLEVFAFLQVPTFTISGAYAKYPNANISGKDRAYATVSKMIDDGVQLLAQNVLSRVNPRPSYTLTLDSAVVPKKPGSNGGTTHYGYCAAFINTSENYGTANLYESDNATTKTYTIYPAWALCNSSSSVDGGGPTFQFKFILKADGGDWDDVIFDAMFKPRLIKGSQFYAIYGLPSEYVGAASNTGGAYGIVGSSLTLAGVRYCNKFRIALYHDAVGPNSATGRISGLVLEPDKVDPVDAKNPYDIQLIPSNPSPMRSWTSGNQAGSICPWPDVLGCEPVDESDTSEARLLRQTGDRLSSQPWRPNGNITADLIESIVYSPRPVRYTLYAPSFGAGSSVKLGWGDISKYIALYSTSFPAKLVSPTTPKYIGDKRIPAHAMVSKSFYYTGRFDPQTRWTVRSLYVLPEFFDNATESEKSFWSWTCGGETYLVYPAFWFANGLFEVKLVTHKEGTDWITVSGSGPDPRWNNCIWDFGAIMTKSPNTGKASTDDRRYGLINLDTPMNETTPYCGYICWGTALGYKVQDFLKSGYSFLVGNFKREGWVGAHQDGNGNYQEVAPIAQYPYNTEETTQSTTIQNLVSTTTGNHQMLRGDKELDAVYWANTDATDLTYSNTAYTDYDKATLGRYAGRDATSGKTYSAGIDVANKQLILGTHTWDPNNFNNSATSSFERIALGGGGGGIGAENIVFCSKYLLGGWDVHTPTYSDPYGQALMAGVSYRCTDNSSHYGTAILDFDNNLNANWWTIGINSSGPYLKCFRSNGAGVTPTAYAEYNLTPKVVKDFVINGTYNDSQSSYDIQLGAGNGRVVRIKGHPDSPDTILTMVSYTGAYPNNYVAKFTGIDVDNSGNPTLYWVRHEIGTSATGRWWYYGKKAL